MTKINSSGNKDYSSKSIVLINTGTINSLLEKQVTNHSAYPPFGLLNLEAVLRMQGYRTILIDLISKSVHVDEFISQIRGFNKSPLIIGISSYTENLFLVPQIISLLRKNFPKTKIILGGPHVSFLPEEGLEKGADFVVRFEGEFTLIELLEHIKYPKIFPLNTIKGISYKDKEGIIISTEMRNGLKDLDFIPFSEKYFYNNEKTYKIYMLTSRGCPGTCIFCSSGAYSGRSYRQHSSERLWSMIYYAFRKKTQLNHIEFIDDTFTTNKKRLQRLFYYIKMSGIKIAWGARSRLDGLDESMIVFLSENGCISLHLGVESVHQPVLDAIKKKICIDDFYNNYIHLINYGILPRCSFIIGHHIDTLETIEETLMVAIELELHDLGKIGVAISTPFPGTPLFNMADKLGIFITTKLWKNYTMYKPVYYTKRFQTSDLRNALYLFQYDKDKLRQVGFLSGNGRPEFKKFLMEWISKLKTIKEKSINR